MKLSLQKKIHAKTSTGVKPMKEKTHKIYIKPALTFSFPMFPFDSPENIRKPLVF